MRQSKPWFRASSNTWVSRVGGRLRTLARGRGQKAQANAKLREILAVPVAFAEADELPPQRIDELVAQFLDRGCAELAAKSLGRYRSVLHSFLSFVGGRRPAGGVRAVDVLSWVDSRGWNRSTRTLGIAVVSRLFSWGKGVGLLEANPLGKVPRPGIARRERCPTLEEIRILIAAVPEGLHELLECLLETGARPSELAKATVGDLQGTRLVLPTHKTGKKTGKPRIIYLTPRALAIVRRQIAGKSPAALIFTTSIGTMWRDKWIAEKVSAARAAAKLGPHVVAYSLRHHFITSKLEQGVPVAIVASLVGTSIAQIDKHYGHIGESSSLAKWVG
jgi:integrase